MPQARYQSTIEPDNSLPILQSQYQSSIEPDNSLTVPQARYQTSNELPTYFSLEMITTTPESQQAEQLHSPLLPRSKTLSDEQQVAKAEVHEQDDQQQTVESLKSEAQTTAESSSGIVVVNKEKGEAEEDKEDLLLCDE